MQKAFSLLVCGWQSFEVLWWWIPSTSVWEGKMSIDMEHFAAVAREVSVSLSLPTWMEANYHHKAFGLLSRWDSARIAISTFMSSLHRRAMISWKRRNLQRSGLLNYINLLCVLKTTKEAAFVASVTRKFRDYNPSHDGWRSHRPMSPCWPYSNISWQHRVVIN